MSCVGKEKLHDINCLDAIWLKSLPQETIGITGQGPVFPKGRDKAMHSGISLARRA